MGNQAIVAFRNADGTYDLHRSPDGATNYQLLVPLGLAATTDDPTYRDFVASLEAPEAALDTKGGMDHHFLQQRAERGLTDIGDADPHTLLEADPFETDVAASSLMGALTPEAQHLYVVDDGLDLYYPAWGSIGLLAWFQETVRIEAYDRDRVQSAAQVDALVDRRPDHTYEGDDFARLANADQTTDWYALFRDNFQPIGARATRDAFEYDAQGAPLDRVRVLRPDWVFVVEPLSESIPAPDTVSRALYPLHIPFERGADLERVDDDLRVVERDVRETALYIDGMLLATEMPVSQDAVRANAGEMFLDHLQDAYGDRIEFGFLPFSP